MARVLILTRKYPPSRGGVEVVAEQHAQVWKELGYEVDVVCFSDDTRQTKIHYRGRHGESVTAFRPLFALQSVYFSLSFLIYVLAQAFRNSKLNFVEVHHPSPLDGVIACLLSVIKKNVPLIVTYHAEIKNKNFILTSIAQRFIALNMASSHAVFVTTDRMKSVLQQKYKVNRPVIVCPIAVEGYSPKGDFTFLERPTQDSAFRVLFIGRLVPYKGLHVLLEAIKTLADVQLTIFGDGPLREELQAVVGGSKDLSSRVNFISELSHDAKIMALSSHDALVLPSISEAEAFGIVQVEAMAFGLPVINTSLDSGVPEVSLHMRSGLTVRPGDSRALAQAICKIKDDRVLYKNLSAGALKRAESFTLEKVKESFVKFSFR